VGSQECDRPIATRLARNFDHIDPRFARNWGSPFLYQVKSALQGDDPNPKWPPYPEFASLCR
jgi:hypothetical protein